MKGSALSAENPFDKPESTPTISWAVTDAFGNKTSVPIGTEQGGVVVKSPEIVQSTGYAGTAFAGKPLFWDNDGKGKKTDKSTSADGRANKAVQQVVTILKIDGEDKALWTSFYPKSQFDAIQAAIKGPDGKVRAIEPGDELYVKLTGFERSEDAAKAASKLYSARFIKGAGAFSSAAQTAAAPPPPPAAAPAPPVAAAPAPVTEPVLSNGFTASALTASGWTAEQIAALAAPAPPAPPVAAPAPPTPAPTAAPAASVTPEVPAASAAPVEMTERERKLAEMTPEDRALLGL